MPAATRKSSRSRCKKISKDILAALLLLLPAQAIASEPDAQMAGSGITYAEVVPGNGMSGIHPSRHARPDWTGLWSTPVELPLLDLNRFAGGLTPLEQRSDHLAQKLLLAGADGKRYLFVTLRKDPALGLDPKARSSAIDRFVREDAAALNPVAELMMTPLLESAGLPCVRPALVVLPDDRRALGAFAGTFGGKPGTIEELPDPGFMGAGLIAATHEVLRETGEDGGNAIDAKAYLTARLIDLLVGDGDRLADQWSWAGYGDRGSRRWIPLPLRHYGAFSRRSGLVSLTPHLQEFEAAYPSISSLCASASSLDHRLLAWLDRPAWMAVTRELQARLSDGVIADAVRRMPPAMYALEGERIEKALRSRRDHLAEASLELYRLTSKVVEIQASAKPELVAVHRAPVGNIEISISRKGASDGKPEPGFRRTFVPCETEEVRIHLNGGYDDVVVDGPAVTESIVVRLIGNGSAIRFEELAGSNGQQAQRRGRKVNFIYDAGAGSAIDAGPGTVTAPPRPGNPDRPDSGTAFTAGLSTAQLNFSSDYAAMAGWGLQFEEYGFDHDPYRYHGELNGAVAFGKGFRYRFGAAGDIATLFSNASLHLGAATSTFDNISHYGLGNETHPVAPGMDEEDFETRSNVTTLLGSVRYPPRSSHAWFLEAGIEAKWITTHPAADSFFELDQGRIVGGRVDFTNSLLAGFHYDSRRGGRRLALFSRAAEPEEADRGGGTASLSGVAIDIVGRYYPERLGNSSAFGKLNGDVRSYLPLDDPGYSRLAFRVGGQKNWGPYPFFEAANVGGSNSIRGYDRNRFSGDASVYANTELRLFAGRAKLIVPLLYGPLLFVDTGRVFLDGENSSQWHTGLGGGLWVAAFETRYSAHIAVARGLDSGRLTGGYGIYAQAGFSF